MKKKILVGVSGIFVIILGICICFYMGKDNSDDEMYTSNIEDEKENSIGGFLTLMLETEADSGVYEKSTSSTWPEDGYIFNSELSSCENGGELSWNEELDAVNLKTNTSERCYVYFDKLLTLTEYIINNIYVEDGVNNLYFHDGIGAYGNLEASDYSYRYSGANPNNYVCFGSESSPCLYDNLYRIIGVFDNNLKLIKADYAQTNLLGINGDYHDYYDYYGVSSDYKGSLSQSNIPIYYWNYGTGSYMWSESELNTINLNTNFLNSIGSTWSDLIANHSWKVGGGAEQNLLYGPNGTPRNAYIHEVGSNSSSTTYSAKVGLMYVSDYYYGASPTYWTYPGYTTSGYPDANGNYGSSYDYRSAGDHNWMFMGLSEWTISPSTDYSDIFYNAFFVFSSGYVNANWVNFDGIAVRPVFYLNSDVAYASGDGSIDNPFRIVV